MDNQNRDKRITEALGIHWHEWKWVKISTTVGYYLCGCGEQNRYPENEDFSTFDGMGLILQKGPERGWWDKFTLKHLGVKGLISQCREGILLPLKLLQDPDRLANELDAFLKQGI
jgi:hypothetical protein